MALEKVLPTGQKAKGTVEKRWVLGDHAGFPWGQGGTPHTASVATGTEALRKWVANGGSQSLMSVGGHR